MRKTLIFIASVVCSFALFAQESDYRPMLVNGRTWNLRFPHRYYYDTIYQTKTLAGPVEFDGKQCFRYGDEGDAEYYYEEDKKVYSYSEKVVFPRWYQEYDFGLKVGESDVLSIDSVEIDGQLYKRFFLSRPDIWIEGIGGMRHGLHASTGYYPISYMGFSEVLSVYDGDKCLCILDDFTKPAYNASVKESLLSAEKTWVLAQRKADATTGDAYEEVADFTLKEFYEYSRDIPLRKVYSEHEILPIPNNWHALYLGQRDDKVYLLRLIETDGDMPNPSPLPVMDFSLKEGDTYRQYDFDMERFTDYVVTAVTDTIIGSSTDKTVRKCLHVQQADAPQRKDIWVEGIGSLTYGFYGMYGPFLGYKGSALVDCVKGDAIFYHNDTPSSATAIKKDKMDSSYIHDLQGRRVNSLSAKGIYIQNGRKVVVK